MKLDIIIPLKTRVLLLAVKHSIPSILSKTSHNNVYVITKRENFSVLESAFGTSVILMDEDGICPGLSIEAIDDYFRQRIGNTKRATWYFQQFLKLGISTLHFISPLYLVWDADAVLLKPIDFISPADDKVYISTSRRYHKPYFETMRKLMGIEKQVKYSFITEHMVFKKEYVKKILDRIVDKKGQPWWIGILECIDGDDLSESGFSEYELYGNYVMMHHPQHFQVRQLCTLRGGSEFLGAMPDQGDLKRFSYLYDYLSFEEHGLKDVFQRFGYYINLKIILIRIILIKILKRTQRRLMA